MANKWNRINVAIPKDLKSVELLNVNYKVERGDPIRNNNPTPELDLLLGIKLDVIAFIVVRDYSIDPINTHEFTHWREIV